MANKLYCPRCAAQFSDNISYCRTCGLSLDGVSEIVNGEAANAPVMTSRPNFKVIRIGMGIFILGMAIGLINGAIKDFGLLPQSYGKMIFLAVVAAGFLTMGFGVVFPTKKYAKRKPSDAQDRPSSEAKLDTAPLTGQLGHADKQFIDADFQPARREPAMTEIGSVTEHTTRNLD